MNRGETLTVNVLSIPKQSPFTFITSTAQACRRPCATRHQCPHHGTIPHTAYTVCTYQLFGELSKLQLLLPLMTTEEGVGVTEVVTTTTVLDLKVRRNENLICTYVRMYIHARRHCGRREHPAYLTTNTLLEAKLPMTRSGAEQTMHTYVHDEDRMTGYCTACTIKQAWP